VRSARGAPLSVAIQNRRRTGFHTVAVVRTNRWGYLLARVPDYRGRWRLAVDGRVTRTALAGA
jgi:hypothetical protein